MAANLNRLSWAVAAFGLLAVVLEARLLGQVLFGGAILMAVGSHLMRPRDHR